MGFIYIWHDGRYVSKYLSSAIPTLGLEGQSHGLRFFVKFMTSYYENHFIYFIHIWPDGRYSSIVFITIPTLGREGHGLRIFIKNQIFLFKFIYYFIKTLPWDSFISGMMVGMCLNIYPVPSLFLGLKIKVMDLVFFW